MQYSRIKNLVTCRPCQTPESGTYKPKGQVHGAPGVSRITQDRPVMVLKSSIASISNRLMPFDHNSHSDTFRWLATMTEEGPCNPADSRKTSIREPRPSAPGTSEPWNIQVDAQVLSPLVQLTNFHSQAYPPQRSQPDPLPVRGRTTE